MKQLYDGLPRLVFTHILALAFENLLCFRPRTQSAAVLVLVLDGPRMFRVGVRVPFH